MKRYIVLVFMVLFLISCGKDNGEIGVFEETGKIMSGYVDTLETSIDDAKKVRKMLDNRYK